MAEGSEDERLWQRRSCDHMYNAGVMSELDPHRDWTHESISDIKIGPGGVYFRWTVVNRTVKVGQTPIEIGPTCDY